MITFDFNEIKTTQAAAILIKKSGGTLNYTKLIKLLYLVDRSALERWERSVTGDNYVLMRKGPVLSNTYDLVNYPEDSYWHTFIQKTEYDVQLKDTPDNDELSPIEISLIEEIYETYKNDDWRSMIRICHKICPEWEDPGRSASSISIIAILKSVGKNDDEIKEIKIETEERDYLKELLSM